MGRKSASRKKYLLILCIVAAGILVCVKFREVLFRQSPSQLHRLMSDYNETGIWKPEDNPFSGEESAEDYFVRGMQAYAMGELDEAELHFKEAEQRNSSDKALPIYLNIYLNQCVFLRDGTGETKYVKKALERLAEYPPLMHDDKLVFELVYTVMGDHAQERPGRMIQSFLDSADGLKKDEVLLLKTYAAILECINGENLECMAYFYDILSQSEGMPKSEKVLSSRFYCRDYLADMYYMCEEYETAVALYQELLAEPVPDPYDNAVYKYAGYVNLAGTYLRQGMYELAEQTVEEAREILPYLDDDTGSEVEANLYDILARSALERDDLDAAEYFLEKCHISWENSHGRVFFSTDVGFTLTQCRYWIRTGKISEAENELLSLMENGVTIWDKSRYEAREMLVGLYEQTGQKEKLVQQQRISLSEQKERVRRYQGYYCNLMRYYEELLLLQKKDRVAMLQKGLLCFALAGCVLLLVFSVRIYRVKAKDSMTDALTGLYNRKKLQAEINLWNESKEHRYSCGILMTDIDYFKKYNDTYGHLAGDEILKRTARIIKDSVRDNDVVIRYGGEEFLVLLKRVNTPETVLLIAERIRGNIEQAGISHKTSDCSDVLTLSLGGFFVEDVSKINLPDAIEKADEALYASKKRGRNTVTLA